MKKLIILVALGAIGCASAPSSQVLLPWECASTTEPVDARVLRIENGQYIYDCNMNGDGNSGEDAGEGEE